MVNKFGRKGIMMNKRLELLGKILENDPLLTQK